MNSQRPRLLAIDDTPANLRTLGAALGGEFDLEIATSGATGLALAASDPPDLILLDVMMPVMDGYETCRRLRAEPATRDIPVIFVTALNSPADETRGLDVGAVDFISKPINPAVARARVRAHVTVKRQADLLRQLALIDGLTGIANRRQFDEALASEWRGCRRASLPLALIMIDVDNFKAYNDAHGHQFGDRCLAAIAKALQDGMGRSHDLVARYGGEEFACLLPDTSMAGARAKAEELRQAVAALAIPHARSEAGPVVSISLGVASVIPSGGLTPDSLLAAADARLYAAKRAGRDRCCWTEEAETSASEPGPSPGTCHHD